MNTDFLVSPSGNFWTFLESGPLTAPFVFQTRLWCVPCLRTACSPAASVLAAVKPFSGSGRASWCTHLRGPMLEMTAKTAEKSTTSNWPDASPFTHPWYPTAMLHWSSGGADSRTEELTGVMWTPQRGNTMQRSLSRWKVSIKKSKYWLKKLGLCNRVLVFSDHHLVKCYWETFLTHFICVCLCSTHPEIVSRSVEAQRLRGNEVHST